MSPLVTILLYVVIPAGVVLLAFAFLLRPSGRQGGNRWRSGSAWDHEPTWWIANPAGSGVPAPPEPDPSDPGPSGRDQSGVGPAAGSRHTARGGARGTW